LTLPTALRSASVNLIRIDNERMRGYQQVDAGHGQNIAGNLTASNSDVTVPVADGTKFISTR
jgi:hypothetical protein